MPPSDSLANELSAALPENTRFTFHHVSTPPTPCSAIYSPRPSAQAERTYCESHFLNVSIKPSDADAAAATPPRDLLVFAIECLIYTTKRLTTIFVSKADSTGFLSLLQLPPSCPSPLRTVSSVFVGFLVRNRLRPNVKLVVDLFARASDQYLFPGSVENASKHVSDDRQLVKWWCRVLDPVLEPYEAEAHDKLFDKLKTSGEEKVVATTAQAYLIVPGEDSIVPFLPQDVRYDVDRRKRWKHGHPLRELATNPNVPARCLIPHFPDDPKGRFLTELDNELPDAAAGQMTDSPSKRGNGEWTSVRSLEQFWETMAYRSECSSGRLVGFIWIVFTPPKTVEDNGAPVDANTQDSQTSASSLESTSSTSRRRRRSPQSQHPRRQLSGPIVPRLPRIKSAKSDLSTMASETSRYYSWPASSRGDLVLADKKYEKATEMLLRLDFADREAAALSTRTWVDELAVLGGVDRTWGQEIVGRKAVVVKDDRGSGGVNVLGVKRKPADGAANGTNETTNVLDAGLVRKKPKVSQATAAQDPAMVDDSTKPGVNVLSAGLVRKKPKKVQPTRVSLDP